MTPFAAALLGIVAGVIAGGLIVWLVYRGSARAGAGDDLGPEHVAAVIGQLRAAAAIVDGRGSVLAASPFARGCGLVRGSQIAPRPVLDLIDQARRTGEVAELELELSRGSAIPPVLLGMRVAPLPDGATLVLGEDRSADLRFNETRRDFVANITHELKTPLGAITLLAEAVEAAAEDPAAVRGFIAKLSRETSRLNELVSQIIALSRLQSEDPLLAAQEVQVDAILEAAVRNCREIADRRKIAISLGGDRGCRVIGDPSQLELAVTNLVQNAIAYSEEGARVAVTSRNSTGSGQVEIRVSDNGIGISEADLPRVFERFYRVDYGRSRLHGGTGLGLSIVKHVAAAHGGEVSVWSKLGRGSTFTLRLPALERQEGVHP